MRASTRGKAARVAVAIMALGALVAGTAACGGDSGDDGKVKLRFAWWGNADRAEVTERVVELFERQNPNITVDTSFAEFNAYFQKLTTEVAGGGAPDVIQMDYRYVREYADRNALLEFSDTATVDTSEISTSLLAGGKIDGKLYAIPLGQNTQEFTYDPAAWEAAGAEVPELGWTWEDLAVATARISAATGEQTYGAVDFGGIEDWFEVWLRQNGKDLYTDSGELGYTADDVTAWWELTNGLRQSGALTPADLSTKVDGSQANDPMVKKLAAAGFAYDSSLTAQTFEIYGREIAIAPFPSSSADLGQYAKPSMQVCVFKRSKHPAEAAAFIDFFINDPEASEILGLSRGMPVNQTNQQTIGQTLSGPPKLAYDYEQLVADKLKEAPPPPPKGAGTVKSTFQRIYDDVIFDKASPQSAAERFLKEAKQALTS
ncbi:MAG: extracellular solute-binding protein [Dactylosporangium sp.]|nr:extracellular solute-binding protein [Dactylosporangium sp.]NNJ59400.1 extracellular solute-binding protein [Dactylosporangium sp.]